MRYTGALREKANLLDDGVVDTLGSVGVTSGVHTEVSINASDNAPSPSRSTSPSCSSRSLSTHAHDARGIERHPRSSGDMSSNIARSTQPRPEERALARVSKDGHKRDRASSHPSRRRFAPLRMRSVGISSIARSDWLHGIDLLGTRIQRDSKAESLLSSCAFGPLKCPSNFPCWCLLSSERF